MSIRNVPEMFGSMVFSETVMKERLPKETYKALKRTREKGTPRSAGSQYRRQRHEGMGG